MIRARSGYRSQCAENWQNMLSGLHVFSKRSFLRKRPPPKTMFCKSFAHDDCQPKLHWSPAFYEACIGRVGCSWSLRIGRPNSDPSVIFSLKYSEMWNSSPWSKEYYILYIYYIIFVLILLLLFVVVLLLLLILILILTLILILGLLLLTVIYHRNVNAMIKISL